MSTDHEGPVPSTQSDARLGLETQVLKRCFDREPFGFTHELSGLDIFKPESLCRLAEKFSESTRDYFIAGSAPSAGTKFYSVPNGGFKPREALENLDKGNYRILLKRPENHDSGFRDLLETLFEQL